MTARLQSYDRDIELILEGLSTTERRALIKEAADETFGAARRQNEQALGYRPPEKLTTDNVRNKQPEDMKLGGYSSLEFEVGSDILVFAAELAKRISPRSGSNRKAKNRTYAENHLVIVDGEVIPPPYDRPDFETAIIANLLPYTRKIERGLSKQRPNGVYEALLYPEVNRRYGGLYDVEFIYIGGLIAKFGKKSYLQTAIAGNDGRLKRRRRVRKIVDRDRVPALIIRPR